MSEPIKTPAEFAQLDGVTQIDELARAVRVAAKDTGRVLMASNVRGPRGRSHLTPHVDRNGMVYVRTGRRGGGKHYLTGYAIVSRDPLLLSFY